MAGYKLQTIQAFDAANASGGPGHRNQKNITGMFGTSPLYSQAETSAPEGSLKLTPENLKQWYIDKVVNGAVPGSDGYYGFTENYSKDFTGAGASIPGGAPNYKDVKTGGGGLPSTAFVPNPASPGEGNGVNAEAKPEAKDFAAQIGAKKPSTPGSGAAANEDSRNPALTSAAMKTTLGLFLGKSPASVSKS